MLEDNPHCGRRFTHYDGQSPWYPIRYLDFPYQLYTPSGKRYHSKPSAKGERKSRWHGQEVATGMFWSAKNQARYRFRSNRERVWYLALEADASVINYFVEPVSIHYVFDHKSHVYRPDILVRYNDGRTVLVEIKILMDLQDPRNQAKFQAAAKWCAEHNMTFEVRTAWPKQPGQ
jgi:hypothetical protein